MVTLNLDRAPVATDGFLGSVPVIDLRVPRDQLIRELDQACSDWGFFQVRGHEVPGQVFEQLLGTAEAFFALPRDIKRRSLRSPENPWGYYDRELTKNVRDKKEVFDIGPDAVGQSSDGDAFAGGTRWPDRPADFQVKIRRYFAEAERVANLLADLIDDCLGAPDLLSAAFRPAHSSFLRLNHYPIADPMAGEEASEAGLGVHHHSDAGVLTLLWQSGVPGLQVYRDGYWHGIEPIADAFVVNIGDMVQVWSNDRYKAPLHRVLAMESVDRFSFPFFHNPAYGTIVEPLAGEDPHYRPIHWGEFRRKRADGDFADYGNEIQIADYRIGSPTQ